LRNEFARPAAGLKVERLYPMRKLKENPTKLDIHIHHTNDDYNPIRKNMIYSLLSKILVDLTLFYVHSKIYVSRKSKTTNNLKWRCITKIMHLEKPKLRII